ncbi:response regulator [Thiotrichales bacterium HSG1]|nr:response regulator [Thiotrichales bacterium HSG1]
MQNDSQHIFLTKRYALAVAIISIFVTLTFISMYKFLKVQSNYAAVINISGKQRMLSQRIALYANDLTHYQADSCQLYAKDIMTLTKMIDLMQNVHNALLNSNKSYTDTSELELSKSIYDIYYHPPFRLDKQVNKFLNHARVITNIPCGGLFKENSDLLVLSNMAKTKLLIGLNAVVGEYQNESEDNVSMIVQIKTLLWLFTLLVLVLEVLFIFRPMVHYAVSKAKKLRKQNTELKQAKIAAEQAARAKTDFLATMSHEIRTPLNGVVGMTNLLLNTSITAQQREFVDTIRLSSDTLLTVINDILDFSKIELGRVVLEEEPIEINTFIEETFDLFTAKALNKNIELLYLVEEDVPSWVRGDANRIRQILSSLIHNALKFTKQGEVFISIKLHSRVEDEIELLFSVVDTGVGIPKNKLDKLFKAFSQVDSSTTRQYGGIGLGLVITKRLCKLMGGQVWVESKVNEGSIFSFTLKLTVCDAPKSLFESKVELLQGQHILVVDDNVNNQRILNHLLHSWNCSTTAVGSGEKALAWLQHNNKCNVAIIDRYMPKMDGIELAKAINKIPERRELPLIVLTTIDELENNLEETKRLFQASICKPIKQTHLLNMLNYVFTGEKNKRHVKTTKIDNSLSKRLPLRILLAEDDVINQKISLLTLEKMGYNIDIANNGLEVLSALEEKSYDIILMDLHMPRMDGLVASKTIVEKYPVSKRPKIIATTASAMYNVKKQCIEAGMDDYMTKPLQWRNLENILEKWGKTDDAPI